MSGRYEAALLQRIVVGGRAQHYKTKYEAKALPQLDLSPKSLTEFITGSFAATSAGDGDNPLDYRLKGSALGSKTWANRNH